MIYTTIRVAVVVAVAQTAAAFTATPLRTHVAAASSTALRPTQLVATVAAEADCGCDTLPGGVVMAGPSGDVAVNGAKLRNLVLADATGARKTTSELIGEDGKAVVIFLRHLG